MSFSGRNYFTLDDPLVKMVITMLEAEGQAADSIADAPPEETSVEIDKTKLLPDQKDVLGGVVDPVTVNPVVDDQTMKTLDPSFPQSSPSKDFPAT